MQIIYKDRHGGKDHYFTYSDKERIYLPAKAVFRIIRQGKGILK